MAVIEGKRKKKNRKDNRLAPKFLQNVSHGAGYMRKTISSVNIAGLLHLFFLTLRTIIAREIKILVIRPLNNDPVGFVSRHPVLHSTSRFHINEPLRSS